MRRGLKATGRDALDSAYLRAIGRPDLPPYSLRCHVGPAWEYERIPAEYLAYFKLLARLRPTERVLDIGCGTGRFAAELLGPPHFFTGTYRGFDVDPQALGWAARRVRSTVADVHFDLLDVRNTHYNPDGKIAPEEAVFPYDDDAFDFAFAMSVFTHLVPATAERYLHELSRVLRPGARAVVSWVLLSETCPQLGPIARERLVKGVIVANGLSTEPGTDAGLLHPLGRGAWTLTPGRPEIVTLFEQSSMEAMVAGAGLIFRALHRGSWSVDGGGPAFQDLVVLGRPDDA